jgi:hypothetical protein
VLGEDSLSALALVELHELPDVECRADHPRPPCVLRPLKPMPGNRRVRIDSSARISSKALLGSLVRRFSRSSQPPTSSESLIVNGLDLDTVNLHISSYLTV